MSMAPSSPRLPSPPPPAEIQITPKSPSMGATANRQASQIEQALIDANSKRRIHPGTKASDMAAGPPLIPLNELDSAFQLQEHLAALHYYHTASNTQPMTRATAIQLATPPQSIDRTLWLYELCRFLISQCNTLIVGFLFDTPPCSAATCPEMRASEWQFLCAVHEQPKSCCAIDYCCHTLDWAANVVTDPKLFPSRFVVLSDGHNKGVAVKNLVNVFRRLHRIFAHAWFQHRTVFWTIEGQTGLYVFFKTVCDMYDLLPAENYKLPPEAEGLETSTAVPDGNGAEKRQLPVTLLKPQSRGAEGGAASEDENFQLAGRTNTRRHIRSNPSTGSAVTTVLEADEEDNSDVTSKLRDLHISAPEVVDEEPEATEVPVIVEQSAIEDASPQDPSGEDSHGELEQEVVPPTAEPESEPRQQPSRRESVVQVEEITEPEDTPDTSSDEREPEELITAVDGPASPDEEKDGDEIVKEDDRPALPEINIQDFAQLASAPEPEEPSEKDESQEELEELAEADEKEESKEELEELAEADEKSEPAAEAKEKVET